jgi:hypothetical protein
VIKDIAVKEQSPGHSAHTSSPGIEPFQYLLITSCMSTITSKDETCKSKPGDLWRRNHLKKREEEPFTRRQRRYPLAMEHEYKTHRPEHLTQTQSSTCQSCMQRNPLFIISPTTECECAPAEIPKNQILPPRLPPSMVYDYLTVEDKQELAALLQRKLLGIPANHLPDLTLSDILYQSPKAAHLPQYLLFLSSCPL